jgi:t-SNARE complex subunit (syntaxin)
VTHAGHTIFTEDLEKKVSAARRVARSLIVILGVVFVIIIIIFPDSRRSKLG